MATMTAGGLDRSVPPTPSAFRRWVRRHPWWVDSFVAGIYFVPTLLVTQRLLYPPGGALPTWVVVGLLVGTLVNGVALLFRRYRPITVLIIITGVTLAELIGGGELDGLPLALAAYAVAVFVSTRVAWLASAAAVAVCVAIAVLSQVIVNAAPDYSTVQSSPVGGSLLFSALVLIGALIGASVGDRRRYVTALVERAEDLARERDQQAQLATAAERARITRELHDIVAHSLSVMVSLADGASALVQKDPPRSAAAIREIGDVGRHSIAEMRRLLGVLSVPEAEAPLAPQPGLENLNDLVATFQTAGLPVSLNIDGERPESASVQATVYRIIQEALTNALRYAAEATIVAVNIEFGETGASVSVTDDGHSEPQSTQRMGNGQGLIGMRERASMYGGIVAAGPSQDGGWRVLVTLPEVRVE